MSCGPASPPTGGAHVPRTSGGQRLAPERNRIAILDFLSVVHATLGVHASGSPIPGTDSQGRMDLQSFVTAIDAGD